MRTLLVMRHAKSSWNEAGLADHDRPLNKRGKHDAPRMGALIRREDRVPEQIFASTARRVRDTVARAAEAMHFEGEIHFDPELYAAEPEAYLERVRADAGDLDPVMVVGHNPGLSELVGLLCGRLVHLPTGAVAVLELAIEDWAELDEDSPGRLAALWLPRELSG